MREMQKENLFFFSFPNESNFNEVEKLIFLKKYWCLNFIYLTLHHKYRQEGFQ